MPRFRGRRRTRRQKQESAPRAAPSHKPDRGARAGMPRYLEAASLDAPRPIDARTRAKLETKVGTDLRDVRVHTGPESTAVALSFGATAFTVGKDIVFSDGRYAPETEAGRRLLAHEAAHVKQQRGAANSGPRDVSKPGDPSEREAERVSRAADSEVVTERTPVRIARDVATATSREQLEKTYQIRVIKGDKDWNDSDLADLAASLGKLSPKERGIVSGYQFQRWTTKENRAKLDKDYKAPPGVDECGLHELTLGGTMAKISLYDGCFDASTTMAGAPVARFNILHEIGHATELSLARAARKRLDDAQARYDAAYSAADAANKAYNAANDARNDLVNRYNAADAGGRKALEPQLKKAIARADALNKTADTTKKQVDTLEQTRDAAERAYERAEKAPSEAFAKLVAGKDPLTSYSKESASEAFAEAFALYKVDPDGLRKTNRKLYDWFASGGELTGASK